MLLASALSRSSRHDFHCTSISRALAFWAALGLTSSVFPPAADLKRLLRKRMVPMAMSSCVVFHEALISIHSSNHLSTDSPLRV
jgi:hypothetical protein